MNEKITLDDSLNNFVFEYNSLDLRNKVKELIDEFIINELSPKFTLNVLKQTIKDTNNYRFLLNQFINSEKPFEQVETEDLSEEGREFLIKLYYNLVYFNIISKKEASND